MAWHGQRGTTTERGLGWDWQKLRLRILARDKRLCQVCLQSGRPTTAREVDHIEPRELGGTDDPDNLQSLCRECHSVKSVADMHRINGTTAKKLRRDDGWRP